MEDVDDRPDIGDQDRQSDEPADATHASPLSYRVAYASASMYPGLVVSLDMDHYLLFLFRG